MKETLPNQDIFWKNACYHPSPNYNERPTSEVSLLVIHNISLPPGQFGGPYVHALFCNQLDCSTHPYFKQLEGLTVSAHALIDRQGKTTQFVPFNKRAWHAGQSTYMGRDNCNDFSIGIELEGTDDTPYTQAQYAELIHLTLWLQKQYPAISHQHIVGHEHIAPGRKTDPGKAFDWNHYKRTLALRSREST